MRKYIVSAVLTMPAGAALGLTHKQAASRKHALKPIKVDNKAQFGTYEVLAPIQFKVGEEIQTDAELNKQLATFLESEESVKARALVKDKEAAEASNLSALMEKAAKWDEFEAQVEEAQAKCLAFDSLPEDVRKAALAATAKK